MDFWIHIDCVPQGATGRIFTIMMNVGLILANSTDPNEMNLANSADPNEMQLFCCIYLCLHFLPKCPFRGFRYAKGY